MALLMSLLWVKMLRRLRLFLFEVTLVLMSNCPRAESLIGG